MGGGAKEIVAGNWLHNDAKGVNAGTTSNRQMIARPNALHLYLFEPNWASRFQTEDAVMRKQRPWFGAAQLPDAPICRYALPLCSPVDSIPRFVK